MQKLIREMSAEAQAIITNIRSACLDGEITYQQRDELIALVDTDMSQKLTLAKNLLYDWTGEYHPDDYPTAG